MKVLITGSNGFVAQHLTAQLQARGDTVVGLDIGQTSRLTLEQYYACNLNDRRQVRDILENEHPDALVHLAAASSVGQSWKDPEGTFLNNTGIFLNIVESIRELGLSPRILSVGSSEEYGPCTASDMPLRETHPLNPNSPYAVARVSQELLSRQYAVGFGLDIIMTRSFNQFGPGQKPVFAIPSFIEQILAGQRQGLSKITLLAGNVDVIRDFLDVRDAASAYCALLDGGTAGEVYNVCSGTGQSLRSLVQKMSAIVGIPVDIRLDPSRVRPTDLPIIIGDNTKLRQNIGWQPKHTPENTLTEIMEAKR